MNRRTALVFGAVALGTARWVYADWAVSRTGAWPASWPKELEPLRKQAGTIQGSLLDLVIHHIPFTKREEFEAAWPHLLKVKSKGAPVILVRSPASHWHYAETQAGVLVHYAPASSTTHIELVVDGKIVDLNRIALPADTPIVDQRFGKERG
ncbi:MAG: hypothetical protein L0211_27130 [Planctomycetaceae bacterium]|nr:hypothetical protein [Planctomycetaceae bacterium]